MFRASKAPRSILLVATRQIGDVLLVTPLLRSLRAAYPRAVIDVLVYTDKGGMLEGNPDCNTVIAIDEHPNRHGYWQLLKRVFRRYDLAVTTQANDRGHVYAFLAARRRIGLVPDLRPSSLWKRASCSMWVVLDNVHTHTVVQNLRLADLLGIPRHTAVVPPTSDDAQERVDALLPWPSATRLVVLHPFPMWRYKRWTREGWRELIAWLVRQGCKVALTGGPAVEERQFCASLADGENSVDLSGQLPLGGMPALLGGACLFIGPDTSVTHLAAACGTPTLAIYGPSNPVKWGPWPVECADDPSPYEMLGRPWQRRENVLLLQGVQPPDLAGCLPCAEEGCDRHKGSASRCLQEMPSDTVIAAAAALLQIRPSES